MSASSPPWRSACPSLSPIGRDGGPASPPAAAGIVLLGFLAFTGGGVDYLASPAADTARRDLKVCIQPERVSQGPIFRPPAADPDPS